MPGKSHKKPSQLDQILRGMKRFNKRVDGLAHDLNSFRKESALEIQTLRQETVQRFDQQGNALQRQISAMADQIAVNEERDAKFRSDVMSMVDFVVRKYDLFEHEKIALGAGQDRLQQEVDLLRGSDQRQNQAIQALEGRVTQLESV
ncbi:MAG: hypothetical protein ACREOO_17130 [bacterium]